MRKRLAIVGAVLLLSVTLQVQGSIVGTGFVVYGHNGSANDLTWLDNVLSTLQNYADPTDQGDWTVNPYAVKFVNGVVPAKDAIYTDSLNGKSTLWRSTFNPPSPFNTDYGNPLDKAFRFVADGSLSSQFSISQLRGYNGTLVKFGTRLYGLDYGPDRIKGTSDDIHYNLQNFGTSSTLVDEMEGIGNIDGWYLNYNPSQTTPQQAWDTLMTQIESTGPKTISQTYSIVSPDGLTTLARATDTFTIAPEPSSLAVISLGFVAMCGRRRRK